MQNKISKSIFCMITILLYTNERGKVNLLVPGFVVDWSDPIFAASNSHAPKRWIILLDFVRLGNGVTLSPPDEVAIKETYEPFITVSHYQSQCTYVS